MSAQPIERPPRSDFARRRDNERAVEVMLGYLALPVLTMTPRPDAVHITVTDCRDLALWMYSLGGEVRGGTGTGADGAALWTLHTKTPARADGSTVAIRVHTVIVEGDDVLVDVRRSEVTA